MRNYFTFCLIFQLLVTPLLSNSISPAKNLKEAKEIIDSDRNLAMSLLLENVDYFRSNPKDTIYYQSIYNLSDLYFKNNNKDSVNLYLDELLKQVDKGHLKTTFQAEIYLQKAISVYRFDGCQKGLNYIDGIDSTLLVSEKLLFTYYYRKAVFQKKCLLLEDAMKTLKNCDNLDVPKENEGIRFILLGQIAKAQKDFKGAIPFFKSAIQNLESSTYNHYIAISALGSVLFLNNNFAESKKYHESILSDQNTHPRHRLIAINDLWDIYSREDDFKLADQVLDEAEKIAKEYSLAQHLLNTLGNRGTLKMRQGAYAEAYVIFKNTETAYRELDDPDNIHNIQLAVKSQVEALSKLESNSELFSAFEEYLALNDSIQKLQLNNTINEYKVKYDAEIKENRIALQKAEIYKQNAIMYGGGTGLIGLLFGSFFYIQYMKRIQKEQAERVKELESQNSELISNVQSQKITKSTLSPSDEIIIDRYGTKIKLSELVYIESSNRKNYIKLITADGVGHPEVSSSLVKFQRSYLPKDVFVRTSKYRIVNLNYVRNNQDHLSLTYNGQTAREDVGIAYIKDFEKLYSEFNNE